MAFTLSSPAFVAGGDIPRVKVNRLLVRAYLKQQGGYGEAEALLVRKHPEYFNYLGGSTWRGRIYTASKFGGRRP